MKMRTSPELTHIYILAHTYTYMLMHACDLQIYLLERGIYNNVGWLTNNKILIK